MSIHHDTPAPTLEEIWGLFRETDRLMKQYAQEAERRAQELDRKFQETERIVQETNKAIGRLGNRLGDFVEGFVAPAAARLFQERGRGQWSKPKYREKESEAGLGGAN
jgi:exonuclease VII large subunit